MALPSTLPGSEADELNTRIHEWQVESYLQHDQSMASWVCSECVEAYKTLLKQLRSCAKFPATWFLGLRQSYETLVLWEDDYGLIDGNLDEVLSKSKVLQQSILELLISIGTTLVERLFPQLPVPQNTSQIEMLRYAIDESSRFLQAQGLGDDAGFQHYAKSEEDSGDSEDSEFSDFPEFREGLYSEGGSMVFSTELDTIIADLKTDVRCLLDLDQLIQGPFLGFSAPSLAATSRPTQSWMPHFTFRERILRKFPSLNSDLVERLALANWDRFTRTQAQRESNVSTERQGSSTKRKLLREGEPHDTMSDPSEVIEECSNFEYDTATSYMQDEGGSNRIPSLSSDAKNGRPFECVACGRLIVVTSKSEWMIHLYSDLRPWVCHKPSCPHGSRAFASARDWTLHLQQEHDQHELLKRCHFCRKYRVSFDHIAGHLEKISLDALPSKFEFPSNTHSVTESDRSSLDTELPSIFCIICEGCPRFRSSDLLVMHVKSFHDLDNWELGYVCRGTNVSDGSISLSLCGMCRSFKCYSSMSAALHHLRSMHGEVSTFDASWISSTILPVHGLGSPHDSHTSLAKTLIQIPRMIIHWCFRANLAMVKECLEARPTDVHEADALGNTTLHIASSNGNVDIAKLLVDAGSALNPQNFDGETPLLVAVSHGQIEVMKVLLNAGASVEDQKLLSIAASNGNELAIRLLLGEGCDVDGIDQDGNTPLIQACVQGHLDIADLLIHNMASLTKVNLDGLSALHVAVRGGYRDLVRCLAESGCELDLATFKGNTPLMEACLEESLAVALILLQYGACPRRTNSEGQSALHISIYVGHKNLVQLCINAGCDINLVDSEGKSPLMLAFHRRHLHIAKLLLKDGGPDIVSQPDTLGRCEVHLATYVEDVELMQLLANSGFDLDLPSTSGNTPLMISIRRGNRDLTAMLLESGRVDPNRANADGTTPLAEAVKLSKLEIVELLLESNYVDPNAVDSKGNTPLMWAAYAKDSNVERLLLQRSGVNLKKTNLEGDTPLILAASEGKFAMVELLLETYHVDPNQANLKGYTPLMVALSQGNHHVAELLLQRDDVDLNQVDSEGNTLLMLAVPLQNDEKSIRLHFEIEHMVQLLLHTYNIDASKTNSKGQSALHLASYHGHNRIVDLLLNCGVEVDAVDLKGRTPSMEACAGGQLEIAKILLHKGADFSKTDYDGQTMWDFARSSGNTGVILLVGGLTGHYNHAIGSGSLGPPSPP